ncbi:MAG: MvaI/BcnI family restriction endonuclease [Candidatus Puniceispirillales bacterium]
MSPISNIDLSKTVQRIINDEWQSIPDSFTGTGAPGNFLEHLFGIDGGNFDTPDTGNWELKFHGGGSLLTLFHQQSFPKGNLHKIVRGFGWEDNNGYTSFRHTIRGGNVSTGRGFYITNENAQINVKNVETGDKVLAYWPHDILMTRFASKFRRLVVVSGERRDRLIRFQYADIFKEPKTSQFIQAIEEGVVAIDFDARTTDGRGLRDHGTKFRINFRDLPLLYHHYRRI